MVPSGTVDAAGSTAGRTLRAAPALILLAAAALRIALVLLGGTGYSSDENLHFGPAFEIANALLAGQWDQGLVAALHQQHHFAFRIPSTLIALAVMAVGPPQRWRAALLLQLSSVAVIALVYALARRRGAGRGEATVAMLFAATATTLTYFARHLMPYDTGLAIDLLALWLALRGDGLARGVLVGAVAALGFFTYYAYLAVAVVAAGVFALRGRPRRAQRAFGLALGAAAVAAPLELVTIVRGASVDWVLPFHVMLWRFLHGAPESWGSSYAEGWWVPFAYLWHVEHLVAVLWVALAVAGWRLGAARATWAGAIALGLYLWLALHSTMLHESVVLGRFVRQIVPFLCLAAAAGLVAVAARVRAWRPAFARPFAVATVAGVVLAAVVNLRPVVAQRFPTEIDRDWVLRYGTHAYGQTLDGWDGTNEGNARYLALNVRNAGPPWPILGLRDEKPAGCVAEAFPHPLAWAGYQYEGYTEKARVAVRARPFLMTLVDRETSAPCPAR
ncbi:MAG TPA: glycosyltransferase family 39 protein [Candidatus Binatia bacterium]